MDPAPQKRTQWALTSPLAESANVDVPSETEGVSQGLQAVGASQALQGVLRHYPRRGISPRLLPVQPRRYSSDYNPMSRSVPRERHARFESPLQREPVIRASTAAISVPINEPTPDVLMERTTEVVFHEGEGHYATPECQSPQDSPNESTSLLQNRDGPIDQQAGHGSFSTSTEGSDSRLRQTSEYDDAAFEDDDPVFQKSVCMLGFSIVMIISVVFVIIVSGLTTLIARRAVPRFTVTADWPDGSEIPLKYGCLAPGGRAQSFPVTWHNVPPSATNLVVLFANPGAISQKGYDPVHWFVTDIPLQNKAGEAVDQMPANASDDAMLMPNEAKQRANVHSKSGIYYPPCPTRNSSLFVMHVYAIDASPVIGDFKDARKIMNRFVGVPTARYSGTYGTSHRNIEVVGGRGALGGRGPKSGKSDHDAGYSQENSSSSHP